MPTFLSQAAAPALRESHGLIINIVDIHALRPLRDYTVYCTAKAGLHMLTRSLAKELGPEIRVNGIAPGPILWAEGGQTDTAKQKKIIERTMASTAPRGWDDDDESYSRRERHEDERYRRRGRRRKSFLEDLFDFD